MNDTTAKRVPPPMRGIKQALQEVRAADPDTALTERGLRRMILTGVIPHVKLGRKYLVNMDTLYAYLQNGTPAAEVPVPVGVIRRVCE